MKKLFSLVLSSVILLSVLVGCTDGSSLTLDDPVTLTMWHVYGSQTESPFNDSINEFNKTVGKDNGIVINVVSVSNSSAIDEALTQSANNIPGAPDLPDLFTAYPRMAQVIGYDNLLDWGEYFTEEELSFFVDEFVEEGYFEGELLMLPIAKSTELLFLNSTMFGRALSEKGIGEDDISTFEGLFDSCTEYYDLSGGKDMFQINDFYHYFLVGTAAFGEDFIVEGKPDTESDAFKKVWEPMAHAAIHGGLCLGSGYASDRWKTGEVICNIGSTAGILYLRDYVTYADNTTEDIETSVLSYPTFEDGNPFAVHRGGGLFALKHEDERKNEAASLFAKWITDKENNLDFVTKAGYLPVTDDAFEALSEDTSSVENEKYRKLYDAVNGMSEEYTYIRVPVYNGASETQASFEKNVKAVLNSARKSYLERISNGEDENDVIKELKDNSLSELCDLYR